MAFPIRDVVRPAALAGQANGRIDEGLLVSTPGQAGGATVRLVAPAARAWRALCAAALAAGHVLKATSAADSYRLYSIQERIFRQRYTTTVLSGRPSRMWNGARWYQKPGTAAAAVPGTSNHGWALAVDTGEERDSDAAAESLDDPTLDWLLANAERFGWSWELQSEPWHLRYFAGDNIPAAVLAYENQSAKEKFMRDPRLIEVPDGDGLVWHDTDGKSLGSYDRFLTAHVVASAKGVATNLRVEGGHLVESFAPDALFLRVTNLDGTPAPVGRRCRVILTFLD